MIYMDSWTDYQPCFTLILNFREIRIAFIGVRKNWRLDVTFNIYILSEITRGRMGGLKQFNAF